MDDEAAEQLSDNETLSQQERMKRRLASKPFIDHLDDAVIVQDGKPFFTQTKGTRVIIERTASVLTGRPWLDTRSYIVESVNQETGELKLQDEEMRHHATSNFIQGMELGYRFKQPPKKGAPLPTKNKAAPKEKEVAASKPKTSENSAKERRVYSSKGIIHTRIKGVAYVPPGETKATDGMRLMMCPVGTDLKVMGDGWEERWSPKSGL